MALLCVQISYDITHPSLSVSPNLCPIYHVLYRASSAPAAAAGSVFLMYSLGLGLGIIALRFGSIPYVFLMYSVRARQFDSEPTLIGAP